MLTNMLEVNSMASIKKSKTKLTTRWIENEFFSDDRTRIFYCENCEKSMVTHWIKDFNFCPGCGARATEVVYE